MYSCRIADLMKSICMVSWSRKPWNTPNAQFRTHNGVETQNYISSSVRSYTHCGNSPLVLSSYIIRNLVGKGLHSTNGQARIKPAVEGLMTKYVPPIPLLGHLDCLYAPIIGTS